MLNTFLCYKGKVHLPPGGDRLTFAPGTTAKIKWSFDASISKVRFRAWFFLTNNDRKRSTKGSRFFGYTLAFIDKDGDPEIYSKLSGVEIEKPAALILNNVNTSYNGSYGFLISAPGEPSDPSYVSIFIAGKCIKFSKRNSVKFRFYVNHRTL